MEAEVTGHVEMDFSENGNASGFNGTSHPEMYYYYYSGITPEDVLKIAAEHERLIKHREIFRYFYFVFAATIAILNALLFVAIVCNRKERRYFRNWLVMHMAIVHFLIGGFVCPFLGEMANQIDAGLGTVVCKLASFLKEMLEYVSFLSVLVIGIYHVINMCSPRSLTGLSKALLSAILIGIPWIMVVMMTVVLRLTMTEEQYGECYEIDHYTTNMLWLVLGCVIPLLLIFICFILVIILSFPLMNSLESSPGERHSNLFVCLTLVTCLVMRTPYHLLLSKPIRKVCDEAHVLEHSYCAILTYGFDMVRLANLLVIPLIFLVPGEFRRGYSKLRLVFSKSMDYSPKKKQNHETIDLQHCEGNA